MNRTTALFLALAALLAHALAIHDSFGELAPPWEVAHVAFRAGRNLVYEGDPNWIPGVVAQEPYPSFAWVGVAALAERLYLPSTTFAQMLGLFCALATVVVLARFSPVRLAGIIAPVLLVVSGGMAAASVSGTEVPLFTLLLTLAFLWFEQRRRFLFSLSLSLLVLTRPEGLILTLAFGLFEIARRVRRLRRSSGQPEMSLASGEQDSAHPSDARSADTTSPSAAGPNDDPSLLLGLLPPLAIWGLTLLLRRAAYDQTLSAPLAALLDPSAAEWRLGLAFLRDWALLSVLPVLLLFPAVHLVTGKLTGAARRALLLVLLWSLLVARAGGDGLPFWCAMVPALPLLALAVQNGMIHTMEWRLRFVEPATWGVFFLALVASAFVSRHAADLGPVRMEHWSRKALQPNAQVEAAWHRQHGRQGLHLEIATVEYLRRVGVFLRDRLPTDATILTPWPGTLGYLSRKRVIDLLGRATPVAGLDHPQNWTGDPKADVVAALAAGPDYVVASLSALRRPPRYRQLAIFWLGRYDRVGFSEERLNEITVPFRDYELISVPVPATNDEPNNFTGTPVHILRRRDLELSPRISLELVPGTSDEFLVRVLHKGHHQLVDLEVRMQDSEDRVFSMRPTGEFVLDGTVHARTGILLYETGDRTVELVRGRLPSDVDAVRLSTVLVNPGSQSEKFFSVVSNIARLPLPR